MNPTTTSQTAMILALSMLKGVGPAALRRAAEAFRLAPTMDIGSLASSLPSIARAMDQQGAWNRALEQADEQLAIAEKFEARILSPLDSEYPSLLAESKDDPFLLFVRGTLASQPSKSVAIIGTREPTSHGTLIAQRITGFFVDEGWSIVSGLALGCDAIAHQTAVERKGHTVAVLAHGLHTIAPSRHRGLADSILASGGALVSQFRFNAEAQRQQFVQRDRVQAGMASGVVMIQSDLTGGSLHASRAALEYGRWLAVPFPTDTDRENNEPKIQANLMLSDGTQDDKKALLKCRDASLSNVVVLRGRQDYSAMLKHLSKINDITIEQHQLI